MRKKLVVFLLIICSVLTVFSGYMVCSVICEYKDASDAYDDLIEFVELPEQTKSETEKSITEPEEPVAVLPAVDFNGLREKAPDVMVGGRKKVISYFCRNGMASVMPFPPSSVHSAG